MPILKRKREGAKACLVLLSIVLFLFIISSSLVSAGSDKLGNVSQDPGGRIDVQDVVLVMRHVLEIELLDEDQLKLADVNCDKVVNVQDALMIMQYALGLIDEFPCDPDLDLSVKALTPYKLLFEFNKEVEELERGDIDIRDENGVRLFVRSVDLDDDGESAEIVLFSVLKDGEEYDITVTIDDEEFEYTFLYKQGKVKEFVLENSEFLTAADKEFKMVYQLMTDEDVDVSSIKDVDISANIPLGQIEAENGIVTIDGQDHGTIVLFRLYYDNDDEIESDRVRVIFADEYVDDFGVFSVSPLRYWEHAIDWEEDDLITWIDIGMEDYYMVPQLLDQYGDDVTVSEGDLEFISYDPDILVVDKLEGTLTPRAEGFADVYVEFTARGLSEVYTVEVLPEVELSELVFADRGDDLQKAETIDEIMLSTIDDEMIVYVWLLDQYQRPYVPSEAISFDIEVDDEDVVTVDKDTVDVVGTANFALELNAGDEGDTVIIVENGDLSVELYVEVFEPGLLDNYEIRGVTDLDLYENDVTNEMTVRVFGVDSDGFRVGPAVSVKWKVDDDQVFFLPRDELTISTIDDTEDYFIDEVGTYKITAQVEGYTIEETFEVIDSTPPYRVLQVSSEEKVDHDEPDNVLKAINEAIEVTRANVEYDIDDAKFISANRKVIKDNQLNSEKPGEATLYITEITVDGNEVEVDIALHVIVEYEPEVNAGNSGADAQDNGDGSATVTITVRDDYNTPMEGFDMEDIRFRLHSDPVRVEIVWETLEEIDDRPAYSVSLQELSAGVYTVEVVCAADWVDGLIDVEVDDVVIETDAEFKLTGS